MLVHSSPPADMLRLVAAAMECADSWRSLPLTHSSRSSTTTCKLKPAPVLVTAAIPIHHAGSRSPGAGFELRSALGDGLFSLAHSWFWARPVICLCFRSLARPQSRRFSIGGFSAYVQREPPPSSPPAAAAWESTSGGRCLLWLETLGSVLSPRSTRGVKEHFYFVSTGQIFVRPL